MFALRTIDKDDRTETNINLGDVYSVARRFSGDLKNPQNTAFVRGYYEAFGDDAKEPDETLYAMVLSELQAGIPLHEGHEYYIVSGNGETYANFSKR